MKSGRCQNNQRGASCPFYVVYLTNLAMQQKSLKETTVTGAKEKDGTPVTILSTMRKVPVNSRLSTAYSGRSIGKRPVNSPLSINTYSTTLDDDDRLTSTTMSAQRKRSSAKTTAFEMEAAPLLTNLLRMSSWNHVHV